MKILIGLLVALITATGVNIKLKPKEEPVVVSERGHGSCTEYVVENRVPSKVNIVFSCGGDVDEAELAMDPHTRLTVDICDPRELNQPPHCFILSWEKKDK
jgi:hypothetical protein